MAACSESFLSPKCGREDETPNHYVGNCKFYQDIRVKYFGSTTTTVLNSNIEDQGARAPSIQFLATNLNV